MKKKLYIALFTISMASSYLLGTTQNNSTVAKTHDNTFKSGKVEVYKTENKKDLKKLDKILSNRNGKIVIEIIEGTVTDNKGNGKDTCGYYIGYDKKQFKKGDKVQSVFVYNPVNNATDDIMYRVNTLIK